MKAESAETWLLQGLAKNDKKAIETIYKDNYNMIQALVVNNNGSQEDAKDVFQESIMVLFEKVSTGSFELNCLVRTFIYSVARRIWLKKLMLQNRYLLSEVNDEVIGVDDSMEEHDKRNMDFIVMEKAMGGLGEPCKSLLEAFYLRKQNMQDIATNFGYTNAENAKNQKYKCLMRLKKIFFSQYKNEPS